MDETASSIASPHHADALARTTFTLDGARGDQLNSPLAEQGINISVSRTLSTRLDVDDRGLGEVIRASVRYYNTDEEIAALVQAVRTSV